MRVTPLLVLTALLVPVIVRAASVEVSWAGSGTADPDRLVAEARPEVPRAADLAITMGDGSTTAIPGTPVTYTIEVANLDVSATSHTALDHDDTGRPVGGRYEPRADSEVVGALVADTFPPELTGCTWTCVASPGSSCTAGPVAGDIADTVDLPGGGTVTYTATCDIDPFATGTLSNTATVTLPAGWIDADPTTDSAGDEDTLEPQADLVASTTDSPDPVIAGDDLTYTVAITNLGPSGVIDATAIDTLPGEVVSIETTGCAEDPLGVPVCTLGMIAPGAVRSYTILTSVRAGVDGVILNEITAASSAFDPVPFNNTDTEPTTVVGDADLELAKTDDFDPRMAGRTQTYRLAVTNNGPAAAAGIVLEEVLPAETFFVSIEPAAPTCTEAGGIVTCNLPSLANGETFEVRLDLWIDKELAGTMVVSGSVTHRQTDPVPGNDADDELTEVVAYRDLVGLPSVNGNASSDVAVLETASREFSVVDTSTGTVISGETFRPDYRPVAMTMIPDFQQTSAPELVILARNTATNGGAIFIRDARTGAPIRLWGLTPDYRPVQVTAIPSIGGSSSWDIAVLALRYSDDRPRVFILDAKDGTLLAQYNFPIAYFPLTFGWVPDFSGGGAPELVVTGRKGENRAVGAIFKDAPTGTTVAQWFSSQTVLPMATGLVPDWDGNGDRWAIFGRRGNDGANRIFVRRVADGSKDAQFGSPRAWLPMDMEIAEDFEGPLADETVLLRWRPTNGDTRVTAKDASDGSFLAGSLTDPAFLPLDLEILPHWIGTPAQEGAVLGVNLTTGTTRVFLKDVGNGLDLGYVDVP